MADKYIVLMDFTEPTSEDKTAKFAKERIYRKGKEYPRNVYNPTKERLDYLLSNKCMKGKGPVIKVKDKPAEETPKGAK